MEFRGKINSLDVDYEAQMIDMSVTVGNKNFDVSFEMYWGDADEFEGWEELQKIVDQNRYDKQGAVMADVDAGRTSLTVNYDGGEAYAYGEECGVDVNTENIPGMNENKEFDFKKFVSENKLEKNLKKAKVEEDDSAFRPKRKHQQQPDKYGKGSHGKLPDFDHAMRTGDPTEYDLSDEDYDRSDRADDAAGEMGLDGAMSRARRIKHFGRREAGDSWTRSRPDSDVLGKRGEKKDYRFKKDGDMYKVDKASMKSDAKGKLKDLKKQTTAFQNKGRQLPEDLQNEDFDKVDERLNNLRENEASGMIDADMAEVLINDFVETMDIQGVEIGDIGSKEITQFMKFGKSEALKQLGTEYK
jgi:hypothetical protein